MSSTWTCPETPWTEFRLNWEGKKWCVTERQPHLTGIFLLHCSRLELWNEIPLKSTKDGLWFLSQPECLQGGTWKQGKIMLWKANFIKRKAVFHGLCWTVEIIYYIKKPDNLIAKNNSFLTVTCYLTISFWEKEWRFLFSLLS